MHRPIAFAIAALLLVSCGTRLSDPNAEVRDMLGATARTEFTGRELAAWRETLTAKFDALPPGDALKIAPELRDMMMARPEGAVHIRFTLELIDSLVPREPGPLPDELGREWRATREKLRPMYRARETGEPYDEDEYNRLRADLRQQNKRNKSLTNPGLRRAKGHNRNVHKRSREAAALVLDAVPELVLDRDADGGLAGASNIALLWARATAGAITGASGVAQVSRIQVEFSSYYEASPGLTWSRPAIRATDAVQAISAPGPNCASGC
jgi:hypothetical protein